MSNRKSRYLKQIFLITVTGFIVGSQWAEYILTVLGIDFFLFEIFLIPLILYNWKFIKAHLMKKNKFDIIYIFLIWTLLVGILFGTLGTNGDIISVATTTRTLIYLVIVIRFSSAIVSIDTNKVYFWSLASIIGHLLFILLIYRNTEPDRMWFYINSISLALIIIIPIIQKNFSRSVLSIILALVISILSGYRINLLIFLVCLSTALLWKMVCFTSYLTYKEVGKKAFVLVGIFAVPLVLLRNFAQLIEWMSKTFNMNPVSVYRITNRFIYFLKGDFRSSQDNIRLNEYTKLLTEFLDNIIPNGLVGKSLGYMGTYTDVPILYLYESFGSVLTVFILSILLFSGLFSFLRSFQYQTSEFDKICGLMFPILLILLIVNGTFIFFVNVALLTGVIIGRWVRKNSILYKVSKLKEL